MPTRDKCDSCNGPFLFRYNCADCFLNENGFAVYTYEEMQRHRKKRSYKHSTNVAVCEKCLDDKYRVFAIIMGKMRWADRSWCDYAKETNGASY